MSDQRVWVVSTGSYSDYQVLCACPTKKDAGAVAAKMRDTDEVGWGTRDARVESIPMVDATVEPIVTLALSTTLWDDGTETDQSEQSLTEWPFQLLYDVEHWRWVRAPVHKNNGGRLDVRGSNYDHVRKVFSDKRAELIASDALRLKREAKGRLR